VKRVTIKLCGITEERDALEAAHLGVDAVGFHFMEGSARYVEPEVARRIVERLPVFQAKVGVFRDAPIIRVLEVARRVGLTAVQLGGSEAPSLCRALAPLSWYKSFSLRAGFDAESLQQYPCTTFLLDASAEGEGGAAPSFDWRRARTLGLYGRILIGGDLDPTNVALAIDQARPYGIDVVTGVEVAPGKKDLDRVERLVEAVRRAERRMDAETRGVAEPEASRSAS
jgi:phosphoribosylanthranilate isomerase